MPCSKWGVTKQHASGDLPLPGVYGVPEQWPHVVQLYQRSGFEHSGDCETVYLACVDDLPGVPAAPVDGLSVRRSVGMNGTRLSAVLGDEVIGYVEVDLVHEGDRLSRHRGWADIGNLIVTEAFRRRGVATWLLGHAADWLRLAHVDRLLDYAGPTDPDEAGYRAFLATSGFRPLTRTRRGWTRTP